MGNWPVLGVKNSGSGDFAAIPHIGQYYGPWAMAEVQFSAFVHTLLGADLNLHVEQISESRSHSPAKDPMLAEFERIGSVALIEMTGTMTKRGSSFSEMEGGTIGLRRAIRGAASDDSVRAILLRIDSPGGSCAGTDDLARDVAFAAAQKPLWAYIEDIGASAAFWVASQATQIFANPSAQVGSIGTYGVVVDSSESHKRDGLVIHIVKAGSLKGMGHPGTEITEAHLAEAQRVVDSMNDLFVNAIMRGRHLSEDHVRELATGAVWLGADAISVGLVDEIADFHETVQRLTAVADGQPLTEEIIPMIAEQVTTVPAAVPRAATPGTVSAVQAAVPATPAAVAITQPVATLAQPAEPIAQPVATLVQPVPPAVVATAPVATLAPATEPPATPAELKAEFPKATAEFRETCTLANFTMVAARVAWTGEIQGRLEERDAELEKANATIAAGEKLPMPGAEPNVTGTAAKYDGSSPQADWNAAVSEKAKELGPGNRSAAVRAVVQERPDLHQAFCADMNARQGRPLGQFA